MGLELRISPLSGSGWVGQRRCSDPPPPLALSHEGKIPAREARREIFWGNLRIFIGILLEFQYIYAAMC